MKPWHRSYLSQTNAREEVVQSIRSHSLHGSTHANLHPGQEGSNQTPRLLPLQVQDVQILLKQVQDEG